MEEILKVAHSLLRYGVLIFALIAIIQSVTSLRKKNPYTKQHNLMAGMFIGFVHLQVLLGLILYFINGSYKSLDMANGVSRFWGMEHMVGMLLAAVLIQIGRSKSKKQFEHIKKHRTSVIYFTIGLLIILAMIPWPFREVGIGRPWFPI